MSGTKTYPGERAEDKTTVTPASGDSFMGLDSSDSNKVVLFDYGDVVGGTDGIGQRTVIVDSTLTAVTGKVYNTWTAADTYVQSQTPAAATPWIIIIYGTNAENIILKDYTYIQGAKGSTRLTGTITSTCTNYYAAFIDCEITTISNTAGTYVWCKNCIVSGGTSTQGDFKFEECELSTISITTVNSYGSFFDCTINSGTYGDTNTVGGGMVFQDCKVWGGSVFSIDARTTQFDGVTFGDTTHLFKNCPFINDSAGTITLTGSNSIDISNSYLNDNISVVNGHIYLDDVYANKTLTVATGTGDIKVRNGYVDTISATGNGSSVELYSSTVKTAITIDGNGGTATFNSYASFGPEPTLTDTTWVNKGLIYDNTSNGVAAVETQAAIDTALNGLSGPRTVIVGTGLTTVPGKVYSTWVAADAYVAGQTPTTSTPWTIKIFGTNSEAIVFKDNVSIEGVNKSTRLTGNLTSTVTNPANLRYISDCTVEQLTLSAGQFLQFEKCILDLSAQSITGGIVAARYCELNGGNFTGLTTFFAYYSICQGGTYDANSQFNHCESSGLSTAVYNGGEFNNTKLLAGDTINMGYVYNFNFCDLPAISWTLDASSTVTARYCKFDDGATVTMNTAGALLITEYIKGDIVISGSQVAFWRNNWDSVKRIAVDNVSNPPTDAELDTLFTSPAAVGKNFEIYIDDNNADSNVYRVMSNGTSWWYDTLTKAV